VHRSMRRTPQLATGAECWKCSKNPCEGFSLPRWTAWRRFVARLRLDRGRLEVEAPARRS
jgi:hypothetical protein